MPKVLYIEDETALQKTLTGALKSAGFTVLNAYDGQTGLALAQKEHPDIVLLDLILPKMNGFEVLASLKKDEHLKKTPVVVLTNLEGMEDIQRVIALGATVYMIKANYDLPEIVAKIKTILST